MFEKAKGADIGTLNKIIDKVFPQVSTSFTLPEILKYASAYSEYKLVGNMGFPEDKYTDMLSEIGSVVVPDNLVSNEQSFMNSCLALQDMFHRLQCRRSVLIFRILQVQRSLRDRIAVVI